MTIDDINKYSFHMYDWLLKGHYSSSPQNKIEEIAFSASISEVNVNDPFFDFHNSKKGERWLRMIAYFVIGILGL